MADRRDSQQRSLDDELEHGWAGGLDIEIGNERPSTGLGTDPGVRRWILGGVGASCLLTAAFVMLASHDETSTNAAAEVIPEPSRALEPAPSEVSPAPSAPVKPVAPTASPRRDSRAAPQTAKADSTLAAGSSAAVQAKPRAPVPPRPVAAPKKTPVTPTPATAPKPAPTAPPEPPKLPSEASPTTSNDELPDVEAWDEADEDAAIATPS